jgi:ribose 5-phosphate isomerase B
LKIALGCDHAGLSLKEAIKIFLENRPFAYTDFGIMKDESVDYPYFAFQVAQAVAEKQYDRGILICGTGIGMCITANKVKGIRAALAYNNRTAELSRLHNDSNILCLGGRELEVQSALNIVDIWLKTPFEGGRHQQRTDLITRLTGL